ncbi:MAG: c-type cytochrome [Candidatus Methylomirabilales bacterium]
MKPIRLLTAVLLGGSLLAAPMRAAAETPGDAVRGRTVFTSKQCARCHKPRGQQALGPPLEELRKRQGVLELAGRLWNHAPAMFEVLEWEGLEWPRISATEMRDLLAYLRAKTLWDPIPNTSAGYVTLVRKGCLKCHRLRGEGGSAGIELMKYHGGYVSPLVWATTIWNHSPQMAEHARRMSLLYPRFTGEEMVNLFGFLKHAAASSQ